MIIQHQGKNPRIGENVYIAPTAIIIGDVELRDGASVWYGAVLRGDEAPIHVGKNTNIQDNCTVHTDLDKPVVIGDNVTIGHNAIVHGCTVENLCLIGIGAVVLNDARIKTGTVVAAGSVVRERQTVGPNQLVAGSPAVVKRELSPDIREMLQEPVRSYQRLSQAHKNNRILADI
jgi:carbonic anhydrase/acetyltransferase-like protein (isoleucine patch superfamily)